VLLSMMKFGAPVAAAIAPDRQPTSAITCQLWPVMYGPALTCYFPSPIAVHDPRKDRAGLGALRRVATIDDAISRKSWNTGENSFARGINVNWDWDRRPWLLTLVAVRLPTIWSNSSAAHRVCTASFQALDIQF
jgi:hypothetical protein